MLDLVGATLKLDVKEIIAPEKCVHLNVVVNHNNAFCCLCYRCVCVCVPHLQTLSVTYTRPCWGNVEA